MRILFFVFALFFAVPASAQTSQEQYSPSDLARVYAVHITYRTHYCSPSRTREVAKCNQDFLYFLRAVDDAIEAQQKYLTAVAAGSIRDYALRIDWKTAEVAMNLAYASIRKHMYEKL